MWGCSSPDMPPYQGIGVTSEQLSLKVIITFVLGFALVRGWAEVAQIPARFLRPINARAVSLC